MAIVSVTVLACFFICPLQDAGGYTLENSAGCLFLASGRTDYCGAG